jgi:hypothetical protein
MLGASIDYQDAAARIDVAERPIELSPAQAIICD